MSVKANNYVGAAALALGVTVAANASPICEGLLNDLQVTAFGAAEFDATGKVIVIVQVPDGDGGTVNRPVADSVGNVRLYGDAAAAVALAKRSYLASGLDVRIVRQPRTATVGDPIVALKAKYRTYKREAASAAGSATQLATKKTGAEALGWDTSVGTPERAEYDDLVKRAASVGEWKAQTDGVVTTLAAALTAAGIDPATVTY